MPSPILYVDKQYDSGGEMSFFRSSQKGFFTQYRYGETKYEDYLLDHIEATRDGDQAQIKAIESAGKEAAARDEKQAAILQDFITQSGDAWDRVSCQLDSMTDTLVSGFSTLSYQIEYTNTLLGDIVNLLDIIAKDIHNPLATAVNELMRKGQHQIQRGLYKEAFDVLKGAEEKDPVNPILQLHLAQLHYREIAEGVPYDLSAAEKHINLAIRYAKSFRKDLREKGAGVIDLVYGAAAHLALVKGGDMCISAGPEAGAVELRHADELLCQIDQPSPSSRFLHAQILTLLEREDEAVAKLKSLADYTRAWIPRALLERNLEAIGYRIQAMSDDLKTNPGEYSKQVYFAIKKSREWAAQCASNAKQFSLPAVDLNIKTNQISSDFEAGAINAFAAANLLGVELETARKETASLLSSAISGADSRVRGTDEYVSDLLRELARNKISDETHAEHMRRNLATKTGGCLSIILAMAGCMMGWVLGIIWLMLSGRGSTAYNLNQVLFFFALCGTVGAVILLLPVKVVNIKKCRKTAADMEAWAAKRRRQDELLQQRIEQGKEIHGYSISERDKLIQIRDSINLNVMDLKP